MNEVSDKIRRLMVHLLHEEGKAGKAPVSSGIRHFDASEQQALTAEARGYLLELSRRGEIPNEQRELIIHYASQLGGLPLERVDVEALMDHIIFDFPDEEDFAPVDTGPRPH